MELLTTDDDGEVLVYECPDCGNQVEAPVQEGEPEVEDQDPEMPQDANEAALDVLEPDESS